MATRTGGTGDVQPRGESLRRAVEWVSLERQDHPEIPLGELVSRAALQFDLSPADEEFLLHALGKPS